MSDAGTRADPSASARESLLRKAIGWRTGIGVSLGEPPLTTADPPVHQAAAAERPVGDSAVAGGAGWEPAAARGAALGELLERYAAVHCPLPVRMRREIPSGGTRLGFDDFLLHSRQQRADPDFPVTSTYAQDRFTPVFSLPDQEPVWVPAALVSSDPTFGAIATSSGLAADASTTRALLRATQELVERDALMITWLHGLRPPATPLPPRVRELVEGLGGLDTSARPSRTTRPAWGERARGLDTSARPSRTTRPPWGAWVRVLDLTPRHSPHPVAMVVGSAPLPDRPRYGAGIACRATWSEAVAKATLEWAQAMTYVGVTAGGRRRPEPADVTSFDEHARFYSLRPDLWDALPIHHGEQQAAPRGSSAEGDAAQLRELVDALRRNGIRLFYRDLTTLDVAACGVRVVRVLSPDLVPIHGHHRWPHLAADRAPVDARYPGAAPSTAFPSPFPHPLG